MKHKMMLSDLYGRIGQILREQGDATIGNFKLPQYESVCVEDDLIIPTYIDVSIQKTHIGKMIIKCCNIDKYE